MVAISTLLWISAKPIIKFVVLGGCGALMAHHGMLSPAGSKVVSGLILNYTLPALLFAKMLSCVSLDNVQELGFVALVAVLYIAVGGLLGILIQRTGKVPKRLYRGIIAASMFTNFGDLPISIILAVSDHPPFLIGDGAKGTAYSSVFISVFYLFLFPLGGYRLIRYDHVKEAQRLRSLSMELNTNDPTTAGDAGLRQRAGPEGVTDGGGGSEGELSRVEGTSSDITLAGDPTPQQQIYQKHQNATVQAEHHRSHSGQLQKRRHFFSASAASMGLGKKQRQERSPQGIQPSFSATSTMISMDLTTTTTIQIGSEDRDHKAKELRYSPHEDDFLPPSSPSIAQQGHQQQSQYQQKHLEPRNGPYSPRFGQSSSSVTMASGQGDPRYSVESMASNGTSKTRFLDSGGGSRGGGGFRGAQAGSCGTLQQNLIRAATSKIMSWDGVGSSLRGKEKDTSATCTRINSPLPPAPPPSFGSSTFGNDHDQGRSSPGSSSLGCSRSITRTASPAPFVSMTSSLSVPGMGILYPSKHENRKGGTHASVSCTSLPLQQPHEEYLKDDQSINNDRQSNSCPSVHPSAYTSSSGIVVSDNSLTAVPINASISAASSATIAEMNGDPPLPKVPPALQRSYTSQERGQHFFWRLFHGTREYLTPPTIGLLLGLLVALTPLRNLFLNTGEPSPWSSVDDLPPLSFIHEITLMLGGCCVPLGLTVLGASLSRLKPGRMRPLIPALTLLTLSKLVLSPLLGILLVQLVLVRGWGWIHAENHMLQFTLMLMSGSPTSITCFVLAQVWDRRTQNAGSEMAALIAVQYGVSTVLLTLLSAGMMYFLF